MPVSLYMILEIEVEVEDIIDAVVVDDDTGDNDNIIWVTMIVSVIL